MWVHPDTPSSHLQSCWVRAPTRSSFCSLLLRSLLGIPLSPPPGHHSPQPQPKKGPLSVQRGGRGVRKTQGRVLGEQGEALIGWDGEEKRRKGPFSPAQREGVRAEARGTAGTRVCCFSHCTPECTHGGGWDGGGSPCCPSLCACKYLHCGAAWQTGAPWCICTLCHACAQVSANLARPISIPFHAPPPPPTQRLCPPPAH